MALTLKFLNNYLRILLIGLLSLTAQTASAQTEPCPPVDLAKLRAMDAVIQYTINDPQKFDLLIDRVSSEHLAELTEIVQRIRPSITASINDEPLKPKTSEADWARVRQILCPYLLGTVEIPATLPSILFNGQAYHDGDVIEVNYDNQNTIYAMQLQNYPAEGYKGWEVFSEGVDLSTQAIVNFPTGASGPNLSFDGSKKYSYDIYAQYGAQKMKVTLTRRTTDFQFKDLWAIDGLDPDRKAKEGEILYLIRRPNDGLRQINYKVESDAQSKDFLIDEPIWSTSAFNDNISNNPSPDYTKKISRGSDRHFASHFLSDWPSQTATTAVVDGFDRTVSVKLLSQDRITDHAQLPEPFNEALNKVVTGFNQLGQKLSEYTPIPINASMTHDFSREMFNAEDEESRHYFRTRELRFYLGGSIATENLPIPGLNYTIPKVGTIGAFFKPSISLNLGGGTTEKNRSETTTWVMDSFDAEGQIVGVVQGGVEAKLLPGVESIKLEVTGFAKAEVTGQITYSRLSSGLKRHRIQVSAYIDPLVFGVSGKVRIQTSLLEVTLLDYAKDWAITERVELNADPIEF